MKQSSTISTSNGQKPSNQPNKEPVELHDDVGLAAAFLVLGVCLHFFATDANIPSWDGFLQFTTYICYAIGFLGAAIGLDRHSKKSFFTDIGMGVAFSIIAYWMHAWAKGLQHINNVASICVWIVFLGLAFLATYGVVRGIVRISTNKPEKTPKAASNNSENSQAARIANIIVAALSLLFGFIQALPIILSYVKPLLGLH